MASSTVIESHLVVPLTFGSLIFSRLKAAEAVSNNYSKQTHVTKRVPRFARVVLMESCNCIQPQWQSDELLMRIQYVSDFFIALAYFTILAEIVYLVKRSAAFPYNKGVAVQGGVVIVLAGATHLINLWTYTMNSLDLTVMMTVAKVLTAIASCTMAIVLVQIVPRRVNLKNREPFMKSKLAELDGEIGLIGCDTQEETC
ncbi:hypothetical protein ACFE04_009094 [Oxalis oulophora]